ncbi:YfhO family protein, partial [Ruminococcus sp.]
MKHISLRPDSWNSERRRYLLTFLLGFGTLLLVFLPVIIADGGYFIYYGDFNSQQIPFYNLANDAVRSGSFGWNWYTDLGANFIGSYAFYLFGSPFFWITTILPRSWVTFSIPILLCIKHGVAALTAYAYIRRFVQNSNAAIVGGLLYAFSGFQLFNLFFN